VAAIRFDDTGRQIVTELLEQPFGIAMEQLFQHVIGQHVIR
jgi:hypothetical protein